MISASSMMRVPSSVGGGKVGQLALESPIFFFNKETWNTGLIRDPAGSWS